jgi:hypothetical protein
MRTSAVRAALRELRFAHVGIANRNEAAILIWVGRPACGRSGSSLSNRERAASYCALQKTAGRSEPADRRTTSADAPSRRGLRQAAKLLDIRGNPKLTEGSLRQKILGDALEIDSAFSNSFFAACRGAGRQLWVRPDCTGRWTGVFHWCLALLRTHLALRRTWL